MRKEKKRHNEERGEIGLLSWMKSLVKTDTA
jgi:hypothetical protein